MTKAEMINEMIFVLKSCDPNSFCRKAFIETRKRKRHRLVVCVGLART